MAESSDKLKDKHLRMEKDLFSAALSQASKGSKSKQAKTKTPAKTSSPLSVASDSAILPTKKRAAHTAAKAALSSAGLVVPAEASGEAPPAKKVCGQLLPSKTTDGSRDVPVTRASDVSNTDGPRSPAADHGRDAPAAAPSLNHQQMMDIARMVAGLVRADASLQQPATDLSVSVNPALTVGGAPGEDGGYRPDLLSGPSNVHGHVMAQRVNSRETAHVVDGRPLTHSCLAGFSWETQMARASGSGLTPGSGLPHGSTSGTLVEVRGSPAHVTLSAPRAHMTTAARPRLPQDLPSVVTPTVANTSVFYPSVVTTAARPMPPQDLPSVVTPAAANTSVFYPSVVNAPVANAPAGFAPGFHPSQGNSFVRIPPVDNAAPCFPHVENTAAGLLAATNPAVRGTAVGNTAVYNTDAKSTAVTNTAENFSRGFAPRFGRDCSPLPVQAEGGDLENFSDSDQEIDTLSPPVLCREDQAPGAFRLALPEEEQEQDNSVRATNAEILRKALSAVAELNPRLVRRVQTITTAGFSEVASEEAYRFAPHPNVESWLNQHWNTWRNMQSLGACPWTPEICPVADWPLPAVALPQIKQSKLLTVESSAAPPPAGPTLTEAQALLKPDKIALLSKQQCRALPRVEAQLQVALEALAATSALASAMSLALRDPANPGRLSATPDPDNILAIMDAFPVALSSLSRALTAARLSATVSRRDEFLALSEAPKTLVDKLRVVPLVKGSMFGPFLKAAQEAAPAKPPASAEDIGLAMAQAFQSGHKQKQWGGARTKQPQPKGRGKAPVRGKPRRPKGKGGRGQPRRQQPPPPPPQGN